MAATPHRSTRSRQQGNIKSRSPGHCRSIPSASTARTMAGAATTSTLTSTVGKSPACRARSAKDGHPPRRLQSWQSPPRANAVPARSVPAARPPPTASVRWAFPSGTTGPATPCPGRAADSGVEGTTNELAHGYGTRRSCYYEQPKAHLQHVFTAIAVNIERLNGRDPADEVSSAWPPTAFQTYLDQNGFPWSKLGGPTAPDLNHSKLPDRVNAPDELADAVPRRKGYFLTRISLRRSVVILAAVSLSMLPATLPGETIAMVL